MRPCAGGMPESGPSDAKVQAAANVADAVTTFATYTASPSTAKSRSTVIRGCTGMYRLLCGPRSRAGEFSYSTATAVKPGVELQFTHCCTRCPRHCARAEGATSRRSTRWRTGAQLPQRNSRDTKRRAAAWQAAEPLRGAWARTVTEPRCLLARVISTMFNAVAPRPP